LTCSEPEELYQEAQSVVELGPDLIEWRADNYSGINDAAMVESALRQLRSIIDDIPLIFTCRCSKEGGYRQLAAEERKKVLVYAANSGCADLIDCELGSGEDFVRDVGSAARENGTMLILSYHDFAFTPSEEFIVNKLATAERWGADIAKIALMPQSPSDVLSVLSAAWKARSEVLSIPAIVIAMGSLGLVSRIAGGDFGSDVTFAAGKNSSAPGQVHVRVLRQLWEIWPK
jgi:3-dehydroquinate dehydratase-1